MLMITSVPLIMNEEEEERSLKEETLRSATLHICGFYRLPYSIIP
jgi:hypothetical protein